MIKLNKTYNEIKNRKLAILSSEFQVLLLSIVIMCLSYIFFSIVGYFINIDSFYYIAVLILLIIVLPARVLLSIIQNLINKIYNKSKLHRVVKNSNTALLWRKKFMSINDINLDDLLYVKKHNLLDINDFECTRKRCINHYINCKNITTQEFITLLELQNELGINQSKFNIIKANFISNYCFIKRSTLTELKCLGILTEDDISNKRLIIIKWYKELFYSMIRNALWFLFLGIFMATCNIKRYN